MSQPRICTRASELGDFFIFLSHCSLPESAAFTCLCCDEPTTDVNLFLCVEAVFDDAYNAISAFAQYKYVCCNEPNSADVLKKYCSVNFPFRYEIRQVEINPDRNEFFLVDDVRKTELPTGISASRQCYVRALARLVHLNADVVPLKTGNGDGCWDDIFYFNLNRNMGSWAVSPFLLFFTYKFPGENVDDDFAWFEMQAQKQPNYVCLLAKRVYEQATSLACKKQKLPSPEY